MTANEKKAYLERYRVYSIKIGRLKEMMELYPDCKEHCSYQLAAAERARDKIEAEIFSVNDAVLEEVLSQKYMCGRPLSEVAERMIYSKRHIERLHKRAIERFEVFEEEN